MNPRTKIYLDIDGTILHEDLDKYNMPANHLREFLEALQTYDVYWLTTHCQNGDLANVHRVLSRHLPPDLFALTKNFKPTTWHTLKTEAIDLSEDFIWFDNEVFAKERENLAEADKASSVIQVNLKDNPNQLKEIIQDVLLH